MLTGLSRYSNQIESIFRTMYILTKYRQTVNKMKRSVPSYLYDIQVLYVYDTIVSILNNIIYDYAREYRFFCEELEQQYRNNRYRKIRCEQAKLKIRLAMKAIRDVIDSVRDFLKNSKTHYSDIISSLTELESLVTEFERNPSGLSDVVRAIEEREAQIHAELNRVEYMFDILLDFMKSYGIVDERIRGKMMVYRCTECGYVTTSKVSIVAHCILHFKINKDRNESEEVEGEVENEQQ